MKQHIEVEVYTNSHRIIGQLLSDGSGLFSFANKPTESYVEIEGAMVNPLHQLQAEGERSSRLWLVKREAVVILVGSRGALGPSNVLRAGYTKPFPYWVKVVLGGYQLRGYIQSGGTFDFGALMFEGDRSFSPLYDAQLSATLFPRIASTAPALLYNRNWVQSVSQISQPREN